MRVRVVDRQAMDERYGTSRFTGVIVRHIEIADDCPRCGKPRGTAVELRGHEWGEYYAVDTWVNDCGHVDMYQACLREAQQIAATKQEKTK